MFVNISSASIPIPDAEINDAPFYKPAEDSPEIQYLKARRAAHGGYFFEQRGPPPNLDIPGIDLHQTLLAGTGEREISTTLGLVRILNNLLKSEKIARHIVPIVADEARTFGMEGMFRQYGIYSAVGQLYDPVDSDQVMYYREDQQGQILQEGISEAGGYSSWIAAATAYRNHRIQMIPFFIYYSMFGFQRIGDLAWASADMRARGFLIGGTSGRTTLAGEGLQHQDGHSHLFASAIPNCISYDPTFAYELAVIIQDGMRRMYQEQEDVFYSITVMNENYVHPALPDHDVAEKIVKGLYLYREAVGKKAQVQLLGSGAILREVIAAADLLEADHGLAANIWSVTSFNELRREGLRIQRWNLLHPTRKARRSYVESSLKDADIPTLAATDYMKAYADQIRAFVPGRYIVLGTDGFGRSDTRAQLRKFFEVDRYYIAMAAQTPAAREAFSMPAAPTVDFTRFGKTTQQPLNRIKRIAGQTLHRNWITVPHVTQFDEADITQLEAFRKSRLDAAQAKGLKLTLLSFLVKAAVAALQKFQKFNASLAADGHHLVLKQYYHIGIAVNTDGGLFVPVIKEADRKGIFQIAHEINVLSQQARAGELPAGNLQGGCFTISSLGGIGGSHFTPIINVPELAILGVSRATMKPVYENGTFVPRLVLPFAVSYDHRVIDGVDGAQFTCFLRTLLCDIRHILLGGNW